MTAGGFDILRAKFGKLTQVQVDQINLLVSAFDQDKEITYPQAAYMLATAWHETGRRMLPIEEIGKGRNKKYGTWYKNSKGELYSFKNGTPNAAVYLKKDYPFLYYGMGFVQLTWFDNYELAGKKLGIDLVRNPSLALRSDIAVKIMILGMKEGWFTGKRLNHYISANKKDYYHARQIINRLDRAEAIAEYAATYEKALRSY